MEERTRREFLKEGALGVGAVAGAPLMATGGSAGKQAPPSPIAHWPLDQVSEDAVADVVSGVRDHVAGNYKIDGERGLKFDGFTTRIVRPARAVPKLASAFTVQGWIAVATYPWNGCSILAQRTEETGFAFSLGARGELRLTLRADDWNTCVSEDHAIALGQWHHVAASFERGRGLRLWIDGTEAGKLTAPGAESLAHDADLRIGMNHLPDKPAHIHREEGSHPGWYSLDGYLRELQVHDRALTAAEIAAGLEASRPAVTPDFPPRVMPSGPAGPSAFGATYATLDYYDEWDALWPVGQDADILVRFEESAARVVFWRGTRYSPAWVTENGLWMADQSVESWDPATYEHMNDFHCRYSHVRILESHPARAVVHWRYAPVSAANRLLNVDPITDWGCWVDEVYTLYPDGAGTRTVSWKRGSLGRPRQFQESIPLCHPGQMRREVVNEDWCTVGNLAGESAVLRYVATPAAELSDLPAELLWQTHNLKSRLKPFIVFEPGNEMQYVRDLEIERLTRPGSSNHWPVGQAFSDGRSSQAADRASSFLGFPISDPPVHESDDGRNWWTGLYGMTDRGPGHVASLARAWNQAPEMTAAGAGARSRGYDRRERAWVIECPHEYTARVRVDLAGSEGSPLRNPSLVLRGWGDRGAAVELNGRPLELDAYRVGHRRRLERTDLVVWIRHESEQPQKIAVVAEV